LKVENLALSEITCPLWSLLSSIFDVGFLPQGGCHADSSENTPLHVVIRRPLPIEG
jgi:hypothetical protein